VKTNFKLGDTEDELTLAAALRRHLGRPSWSDVRRLCATGKVRVDGRLELDAARRMRGGQELTVDMNAPRPRAARPGFRIVLEDAHLVVIEKPEGVSSVPYERKETGTALDLVREAWREAGKRATATPLYIVHRIDKDTSGLLCFAKTRLAERALHHVFQRHAAAREYVAVAHGAVTSRRIESRLVPDRGDGIRGSTTYSRGRSWAPPSGVPRGGVWGPSEGPHHNRLEGQHAVTHVTAERRLRGATLCRVRLETGRTHQIRVHLSEAGHPLVGETVYIRDFLRAGGEPLPSPRLMLHAETLGFPHPVTGAPIDLRAPPPPEFAAVLEELSP